MNKRRHPRRRALLGAKIIFNAGRSAINTTVRNISASGAQLLVETPVGIPDDFLLEFDDKGHPARKCRVAWRQSGRLGVEFTLSGA